MHEDALKGRLRRLFGSAHPPGVENDRMESNRHVNGTTTSRHSQQEVNGFTNAHVHHQASYQPSTQAIQTLPRRTHRDQQQIVGGGCDTQRAPEAYCKRATPSCRLDLDRSWASMSCRTMPQAASCCVSGHAAKMNPHCSSERLLQVNCLPPTTHVHATPRSQSSSTPHSQSSSLRPRELAQWAGRGARVGSGSHQTALPFEQQQAASALRCRLH
jgi:hypothetical protein